MTDIQTLYYEFKKEYHIKSLENTLEEHHF